MSSSITKMIHYFFVVGVCVCARTRSKGLLVKYYTLGVPGDPFFFFRFTCEMCAVCGGVHGRLVLWELSKHYCRTEAHMRINCMSGWVIWGWSVRTLYNSWATLLRQTRKLFMLLCSPILAPTRGLPYPLLHSLVPSGVYTKDIDGDDDDYYVDR